MPRRFVSASMLVVTCLLVLAPGPAHAQTLSPGPYYALPSWDQILPVNTRFVVLSNWIDASHPSGGAAVLDRESGLVWQRSPGTLPGTSTPAVSWDAARSCIGVRTGGRMGWRLPSVQELASLVDPSVPFPGPTLPAGHPFDNTQMSFYWTATTLADITTFAWAVDFVDGGVSALPKTTARLVWCVRGGGPLDAY